jgi:hypothetical protein
MVFTVAGRPFSPPAEREDISAMKKVAPVLSGIGSPNARLCLPVLMILGLMAVVLFTGACSEDEAPEGLFPTQPQPDTRNWLFTVRGTSATNIYAGGTNGAMFRYDGNAQNEWTQVPLSTRQAITELWDAGGGTMYATGHGGLILRNTGGGWSPMTSGTSKDLFGIGRMRGSIYACGLDGTLLKLNGSSWNQTGGLSWILDANRAPVDTLVFSENIASLITVNSFFIGGAYDDPNFEGEPDGIVGTKGGVFEFASLYDFPPPEPDTGAYGVLPDWILRPLSGEQIVDPEWMLASTSDPADLSRNYLGTSEGWLFQLGDARGDTVWTKFYPSVTNDPGKGIQDLWLDAQQNIYMVTDEGKVIYQTADYNFVAGTGTRTVLFENPISLTSIWGVDPGQFYVTGYIDDMILRCSHDPSTGYFNYVAIMVPFPESKTLAAGPTRDKFGRPLY